MHAPVTNLLYKLKLRKCLTVHTQGLHKTKLPSHRCSCSHGQSRCRQPFWSPSFLLATLVITLLALAAHHLAKHHDTIAIHEGHT